MPPSVCACCVPLSANTRAAECSSACSLIHSHKPETAGGGGGGGGGVNWAVDG